MFSSNQVLEVSGKLNVDSIRNTLEFALKLSGNFETFTRKEKHSTCVYQITEDGKYCIGWAFDGVEKGWSEFPFDFDLDIISRIICQHLEKQGVVYGEWDGSYGKGFVMRVIEETLACEEAGVKNPFYGIVSFESYTCFYAK